MQRTFRIRPGPLTLGLCVWLGCEIGAFVLVARAVGIGGAILIGLATTLIGLALLRRVSLGALRGIRRTLQGTEPSPGAMLDGSLLAIGAVLLIIPGFLSDFIGLALAAPSVRQWLAHRFGAIERPGHPPLRRSEAIDLPPSDWQRIDQVEAWPPDRER